MFLLSVLKHEGAVSELCRRQRGPLWKHENGVIASLPV